MGHLPSLVHTGAGSLDSASVLDARIALCSLMAGLVSDRHLIQAIRRPAPEILAPSRYRAKRPSGACGPGDAGLGAAPGCLSGSDPAQGLSLVPVSLAGQATE